MNPRLVLVAAAFATLWFQRAADARLRPVDAEGARLRAWSGPRLRHLFAGFENAVADLYWLRAVQYYGGQRAFSETQEYDLIEPLIDNVVTLDPRLAIAYQLGATFLAEPPPLGMGRPRAAVQLLDRGVAVLRDDWMLWRDAALFRFDYLRDGAGAVARLREASALPGAPYWLETLAADLARRAGDPEAARGIWLSLVDSEYAFVAQNARRNLKRLDALQEVEQLQAKVDGFAAVHGQPAHGWSEMISAGLLGRIPADPEGVPYEIHAGAVTIARRSPLWRPETLDRR